MYEYRVTQLLAGGNIAHLNDRMAGLVAEGWAPIMMCGDNTISVMLRREKPAEETHHAAAQARHPALIPDQPEPARAPAPPAVAPEAAGLPRPQQ
jgi:hypothetical protein